jgi:PKD repeat protein
MRLYLCLILLIMVLGLVHPAACNEIAYAIGSNGEKPVGQANITEYKSTDIVSFTTSRGLSGPPASYETTRTVESIKDEINKKINRGNEQVREIGLRLAMGRSGAQRIDQICSIYDYMVGNWTFVSDPRGLDVFQYSNYTLEMGKEGGYSGIGDCDDFSILLASLVDSIGGTPRIILAYSPAGGHAYTEVYLGKKDDRDVDRMLKWLRKAYNADVVNVHADNVSDDVWLNMDWWKDPGGANHPGGPFYQATSQVPIYIQEDVPKSPLTPIENKLPRALLDYAPLQPEVDEFVSFDASKSSDLDGKIVDYEWDFGDGDSSHGASKSVCRHIYSSSGKFLANLTVTDNEGDQSTKTLEINVKEPLPEAIITYSPINPQVGEAITFDASQSKDKRGQITKYEWDFDDGNPGYKAIMKHRYEDSGTYNVNLTVTNDRGIKKSSSIVVVVSQKVDQSAPPASSAFASAVEEIAVPATNQKPTIVDLYSNPQDSAQAGTTVVWTAQVADPENDPLMIRFLLNGMEAQGWSPTNTWSWNTADAGVGQNRIEVQVTDNNHGNEYVSRFADFSISSETTEIDFKEPLPEAIITYSPINPQVGEAITFDASQSKDKRGRIVNYEWDFDDGYSGNRVSIDHQYLKSGTYNVKLTVTNDKGVKNSSFIDVVVQSSRDIKANSELANVNAMDWVNQGLTLYNQEKYDEAIQAYDKAIELDPNYAAPWNNKGIALGILGKYDEALVCFDEAIRLDPKYAEAWYNKGVVLEVQGKYDEALVCFDEAVQLKPDYAMAYDRKGNILQDLGRTEEANAAFAKV